MGPTGQRYCSASVGSVVRCTDTDPGRPLGGHRISPAHARLSRAALAPAKRKGTGKVEKGRVADLVLLDADPLRDIHNTTKMSEVFLAGKEFDRAALDQMLRNAEASANSQVADEKKGIEDEIIALEKQLWNGNANEVSKLEAEDYEVIKHAHRYHRADDEAAAKDVKFALVSMDDIRVRMLRSDVALITYHASQKGSFRGTEVPTSFYFGSIWVNRGGEWKNVFLEENLPNAFTEVYKPISERDGQPRP